MWAYYPELLEVPVPRYTSFPTAAEFSPAVGNDALEGGLASTCGDISLYVHIPFCEKICWYCGCNTSAANRVDRLESYLDALHREITLVGKRLAGRTRVRSIAFGGGSPNAIAPTDFVRIADALTLNFKQHDPVWSVELDPRQLDPVWGKVARAVGITRASLGVQTFDPQLQQAIGRVQPDADIARATDLLRGAGINSLNFDLMYGLPGQDLAKLEASLARTVELGADRIALFGYAHVPHIVPRQKRIDATGLPDQPERFAMAAFGHDYLTAAGYQAVGFDHFALPGDPLAVAAREGQLHRNFQGFTEDASPVLIGLGSTAISCFPDRIVQNEKNAGRYRMMLSQDRLTGAHGVMRSAEDQARGAVITALLCHAGARIEPGLLASVRLALTPFIDRGLARIEGDRLEILPQGTPYARSIAALFDPYRQDSVRRFSSAV